MKSSSTIQKIIFLLLVLYIQQSFAETKNKTYQGLTWIRYNQSVKLPKNFVWNTEIENRFFIAKKAKQHQFTFRIVFLKQLPKKWNIGLGFSAWSLANNDELHPTKLMIPEWRPHLEISHQNKITDRLTVSQRIKAEYRFIKNTNKAFTETIDGYTNSFRFRFQLAVNYTVYKKDEKSLQLIAFDEIMLNAGKSIVRNIFDQNRFGVSARYNFNNKIGMELGYINWFQQRPSGIDFYNRQILRYTLHTNFEIKKKSNPKKVETNKP